VASRVAPSTAVELGPLRLQNPVMTASGCFGYGVEYAKLIDVEQLGAVVTKAISPKPREGNPGPRTVETPSGDRKSTRLNSSH